MAQKQPATNDPFQAAIQNFLTSFAKQAPYVRDCLTKDLPAYNRLLSLNAHSFEEFALMSIAESRGEEYNRYAPPIPNCPHCLSYEQVRKKEEKTYFCRTCKKSFTANYHSISSSTHRDALTWMKVLQCLIDCTSIKKTCDYCNLSESAYYSIRNRLFYAMQKVLEDVKLYGVIEADNTFMRTSYKGLNLQECAFDDESMFWDAGYKPRAKRARGGAYNYADKNANHICIFAAIDDYGHVLVRYAGIGNTNHRTLKRYVSENNFLLSVPGQDPFQALIKPQKSAPKTVPGDSSLMVSDKEGALRQYTRVLGIPHEAHVFRRNGKQVQLPPGAHNIQRVNALHSRLKAFLRNCHGVSSKYLPGYLVLFEFLENTAASEEAIRKAFQVLAKPNADKPAEFFNKMYSVPNRLLEWINGQSPLSKIPYEQLLGYFLYDHRKHPEDHPPGDEVTIAEIEEETNYSIVTIRHHYSNMTDAGYRELILDLFYNTSGTPQDAANYRTFTPKEVALYEEYAAERAKPSTKRKTLAVFAREKSIEFGEECSPAYLTSLFYAMQQSGKYAPFPPAATRHNMPDEILEMYDKYIENCSKPRSEQLSQPKFVEEMNRIYKTKHTVHTLIYYFDEIELSGQRPLRPKKMDPEQARTTIIYDRFDEIYTDYRRQGLKPPITKIYQTVGEEFGLTQKTVEKYVAIGRTYRSEHPKE